MTKLEDGASARRCARASCSAVGACSRTAQHRLHHPFIASNTFWQAVKKGFDDACAKIQANCQMIFTQTEGSIEQQAPTCRRRSPRKPDALITSIVDNKAFGDLIKDARDKGVIVIAANVDDTEGAAGNARQAFIGQGFMPAGYTLAQGAVGELPQGRADPRARRRLGARPELVGAARRRGSCKFLEDYKKANPGRETSSADDRHPAPSSPSSPTASAPTSTPIPTPPPISTPGFWHAAVARVLHDRGVPPGKVLLGGFDLVPEVLAADEERLRPGRRSTSSPTSRASCRSWRSISTKKVGLAPADIDTGPGRGDARPGRLDHGRSSTQGVR